MYPKHFLDYFREFDREDKVFVAMPIGDNDADHRWNEIFRPAICEVDLKPNRVDERPVSGSIPSDILKGINQARLVLADISRDGVRHPNPNVLYELGIAHAARLEEEVVVVRAEEEETDDQDDEGVPFDLRHIRHHKFDPNDVDAAVEEIADVLEGVLGEIDKTRDLIVDRTIRRLDHVMRDVILDHYEDGFVDHHTTDDGDPQERATSYGWAVLPRLLDMGVVRAKRHPKIGTTRYRFTELGKIVGDELPARAGIVPEDPDG